jgi:hypothetical protein
LNPHGGGSRGKSLGRCGTECGSDGKVAEKHIVIVVVDDDCCKIGIIVL